MYLERGDGIVAVSTVKIASIIGVMSELDKVIKFCGESQVFHPDDALSFYDNTEDFTPVSEKNPYTSLLQTLKENVLAAGKPLKFVDVKKFNVNRKQIGDYVTYLSEKLGILLQKQKERKQAIVEYQKSIAEISHFLGLSFDLNEIFSCQYIKARFGSLPKDSFLKLTSYSDNPYVLFFPCTSDDLYYWGVYFAPVEEAIEIDHIFSGLYFKGLDLCVQNGTPEEHIVELNKKIKEEEKQLDSIERKIEAFWKVQYEQCMRFYSKLEELNTYFGIKQYVAKYHRSFILVGWIPAENEAEFTKKLDQMYGVEYSIETAEEGLKFSPPVKLKNKKLFRPFEFFVDMYGLPNYDEIDPTIFVAATYTILFGIMFADLGQGLVLSIVGYLMWRMKKMQLGKILIRCGISSALFGIVFGSCFGFEHALDPFYQRVFGLSDKPIEVMEPAMTNDIIYTAIGIGIVLVLIAMSINIYSSFKRRRLENAIFGPNGIAGLLLYGSAVVGLVCELFLNIHIMNLFYIIFLIVIPLICILFREVLGKLVERDPDWKPERFGDYVTENAFELFEIILSYVTNTMSFLRVGAFVLVHAGMMLVVFTLADMAGAIGYPIVVVIGNAFVMALEALLVGIQVLRLDFYEMFSRFFDGQGRPFEPVRAKKVTE